MYLPLLHLLQQSVIHSVTVVSSSQDRNHPSPSDQITMPGLLPSGTVKHWILLTYQPVIVIILLVVAVAKWYSRRGRSRRKTRAAVGEKYHIVLEDERRSRSIPCNGARLEAIAEESDEEHATDGTSKKKTSCMSMPSNWTRYILTYQPAPLPIVHRALSENSTTL